MNASVPASSVTQAVDGFADKHVVHVVRQYFPNVGGLEDVVRSLVARQRDRFASVKVVTLDKLFVDPDTVLPHFELVDGVEVHRIPYWGSQRYPVAPRVLKEIAGADLVHVHAVDFFFDALALTQLLHGRKLVATTHGGFFHTRKFYRLKQLWFRTLTRLSASRYEALACCSEADLRLFNKIAPGRSMLIENGVAIEKFSAAAATAPQKCLLTFGRFSVNKRLDRLIDMMVELVKDDADWRLHIAGVESDLTLKDLNALVGARGLEDKIEIHVGLPDDGLRELMGRCSYFVSASEHEGFGLAMIEALSAGLLPVVHENEAFLSLAAQLPRVRTLDFANASNAAKAIRETHQAYLATPAMRMEATGSVFDFSWDAKVREYDQMYQRAFAG